MPIYSAQVTDLEGIGPIVDIQVLPTADAVDAMEREGTEPPSPKNVAALIDTGASASVIQESVAEALGLAPIGQAKINTPSCQGHPCFKYALMLLLPTADSGSHLSSTCFETEIIAAPLAGQNIQCLLGRDFLSHTMMVYNGPQNAFYYSI